MYVGHVLKCEPIPMSEFDPMAAVKVARQHLETIKEPRRRQVLENFIEHAEAEGSGDYERLMASCSKRRQQYATYGSTFGAPQSYAELEVHYKQLIASNVYLIHFELEKLAVGDDVVFLEGIVHQLCSAEVLKPMFDVEVDDQGAVYQLSKRVALTFVFDEDGLGAGEHSYSDGPTTRANLVKVAPEEVPEAFFNNPLATG